MYTSCVISYENSSWLAILIVILFLFTKKTDPEVLMTKNPHLKFWISMPVSLLTYINYKARILDESDENSLTIVVAFY